MKIKITGCSSQDYWYSDIIGMVFEVTGKENNDYYVSYNGCRDSFLIDKIDCEIIIREPKTKSIDNTFDTMRDKIKATYESHKEMVLEKNKRYGNSAVEPLKCFSKLSGEEGIKIRLDDKLKRIMNSEELRKNDVSDLMGYLMLLCIPQDWTDFSDLVD